MSALVWVALAALTLHNQPNGGHGAWVIVAMMIVYAILRWPLAKNMAETRDFSRRG